MFAGSELKEIENTSSYSSLYSVYEHTDRQTELPNRGFLRVVISGVR